MSLIEEILKYSKVQSQVVIVILIGIIIVGSIAGGIWIHNLQSSLSEIEKLNKERIELIEERYRNSYAQISIKYDNLELRINKFELAYNSFNDSLRFIANEIRNITQDKNINSTTKKQLLKLSDQLTEQTKLIAKTLAENTFIFLRDSKAFKQLEMYKYPLPRMVEYPSNITVYVLLLFIIIIITGFILMSHFMRFIIRRFLLKKQ